MSRTLVPLLSALLLAAVFATPAAAGTPAARLSWAAEWDEGAPQALLLVLERGPEGWRLLDARTAAVRAKIRPAVDEDRGPIFAVRDLAGQAQVVGRLVVPERIHGPAPDDAGKMRCVSVPWERAVLAVRLPLPPGAAEFAIFEAEDFAPKGGVALAAALSARAADAGLELVASFDLRSLERAEP